MALSRLRKNLISILFISSCLMQPAFAMDVREPSNISATHIGLVATTIGLASSWLGYRYYCKRRKELQQEKQSDQLMQDVKTTLPKGIPEAIAQFKIAPTQRVITYNQRIKLLPAIVSVPKHIVDGAIDQVVASNRERIDLLKASPEWQTLKDFLEESNNKLNREKSIALYACVISSRGNGVRMIDLSQKQLQDTTKLLFKNEIRPSELLGQKLLPGQVAIVGYSDGDLQLLLENNDLNTLNRLTDKEKELLEKLYKSNIDSHVRYTVSFDRSQWHEYQGTFTDVNKRECITNHYGITLRHAIRNRLREFCEVMVITIGCVMALVVIQKMREAKFAKLGLATSKKFFKPISWRS